MRLASLLVMVIASALALGMTCGPGDPDPSSDTCEAGGAIGAIDAVTIGRFDGTTFTAFGDGDVAPIVYGGQGFPMLVVNLRLEGSGVPGCVPQVTRVRKADGALETSETLPLTARQVLPGTWITGDALLVVFDVYDGVWVTLEAEVGGVMTSVGVWAGSEGTPDAAPDAPPPPDAAPAVDAAQVPPDAP